MIRLSMAQALSLWTDLEAALRGEAAFGGHVAELYVYRCMSMTPRDMFRDAHAVRAANESLHSLLVHFATERNADITILEGREKSVELGEWLKTSDNTHRWHVRVEPR
jgi:hypothetical protein